MQGFLAQLTENTRFMGNFVDQDSEFLKEGDSTNDVTENNGFDIPPHQHPSTFSYNFTIVLFRFPLLIKHLPLPSPLPSNVTSLMDDPEDARKIQVWSPSHPILLHLPQIVIIFPSTTFMLCPHYYHSTENNKK